MSYYLDATIARDRGEFVVHVWDAGDLVCTARAGDVPQGSGVDQVAAGDGLMNATLAAMGYRIVGGSKVGQRVVARTQPMTYAEFRELNCDQRYEAVRDMPATVRPLFLARLEWDDCEFLAESAFLSRDHVYRDQIITRLGQLATPGNRFHNSAIKGYQHAAAMQDAKLGHWAPKPS